MTTPMSRGRRGKALLGPRIFAAGALLLGLAVFYVAYRDLRDGDDNVFSPVNPAFAPLVITGLWVVFSAIFLIRQLVDPHRDYPSALAPDEPASIDDTEAAGGTDDGGDSEPPDDAAGAKTDADTAGAATETLIDDADADPADVRFKAPALLIVALVVYVFALEPIGFIFATGLFFIAVAWIFGSRRFVRDAIVGALLSVGVYYLFTQALYLALPSGEWLPWTF